MYKADKATTERNAKTLRELVKHPDNKLCADCKRNDPRWASWNLGVYLCIRCSGIHRGMGTHISRVKSIDLDVWTPEQMESIQKWGNRRANVYWEAHLKAGHIPPDHKMDSFIRSKYESRRWAMDGPPLSDPSALDDQSSNGNTAPTATPLWDAAPASTPTTTTRPTHAPTASLSAPRPAPPSIHSPTTLRQNTQSRQLLSAAVAGRVQVPTPPPLLQSQPQQPQPQIQSQPLQQQDDLFSLDFHAPASKPPQPPAKDVKQDILSLFSAPAPPAAPPSNAFGQWDALGHASQVPPPAQAQQPTSMMGTTGTGFWGVSSGWNPTPTPASTNIWGAPANTTTSVHALNTTDIWGGGGTAPFGAQPATSKKDDVFGDLWGDFK